ncbi:hypothetical protein [Helicobacter pylori]|uniref:hypothetical protein n=1 Tax=Helicobacter pylori TaxID=210 RepID=UPI0009A3D8A1|nr:hypothetical protein [Helicobacter pylori]NHB17942.1 hypothetical protein [Helicobacter pylori]OPG43112.1 hypothetical protein BGL73_05340 [Helicobacter pylori]QEF45409.1 hypothetical protein D2C71_06925 [Helicobacter pylori]
MLLNYDFLQLVDDEPKRLTSLTAAIDKALAGKKLARQNKPRVRVKDNLSLSKTLDAFGEELSRLKNQQETIKASTIESSNLNSIVNKIKSRLPFGTISAFRPFKEAFIKDFTEKEREKLIEAYKSGYKASQLDKVSKKWRDDPNPIDASYLADAFLREYRTIALKLSTALGKSFVNKFLNPKSETTMKDLMSSKEFVARYRYTQKDNMKRTRQLKGLLDSKRDFIGYIQVIGYWKESLKDDLIPDKETSFFVFVNEPSSTFYLRNHLLLWARLFNQAAICYCDNAKTDKVELVSTLPIDFGDVWAKFTDITFSVPLTQSLTRLHNKVYTFFEKKNMENYGVSFEELSTTKLKAMIMPKDIEGFNIPCKAYIEHHIKTSIYSSLGAERNYPGRTFDMDKVQQYELQAIKRLDLQRCSKSKSFKASYNHNIKVNNLVKAMRQGKKASKTLIANVLANTIDTDAGYCFISDLATQLGNISPRLSKSIVTAIEQAQGLRLLYALIDKVSYNSLHNTLNFIFDIDNPMSDEALNELVVEVPREALKNVKLPQIKNVLTAQIFDGAYHFRGNDYSFKG